MGASRSPKFTSEKEFSKLVNTFYNRRPKNAQSNLLHLVLLPRCIFMFFFMRTSRISWKKIVRISESGWLKAQVRFMLPSNLSFVYLECVRR